MAFWSTLAKIGSIAAPIAGAVAAPFTGGASLALGSMAGKALSGIASTAGAAAAASAEGRQQDANYQLQRDKLLMDNYQQDLQNRATLPKTFARQAAIGDVMANYNSGDSMKNLFGTKSLSDAMSSWNSAPRGYTGDTARTAQAELSKQAMANLLNPPKAPEIKDKAAAGGWEKALGGIGLGGSLGSALLSAIPGTQPPKANSTPYTGTSSPSVWGNIRF
ncbi:MAG: hypothetical protein ACOYD0_13060 [Candidatus Nanopelagicales bacterium]